MWKELPFWALEDFEIYEEITQPKIGVILHKEAVRLVSSPYFSFESFWRQIEDPFYDISSLDEWIIANIDTYKQIAYECERKDEWCANLRQIANVLDILQILFAAPTNEPVLPWSIGRSEVGGEEEWDIRVRLSPNTSPYTQFSELYWKIVAAVDRSPYPGLVVISPRLVYLSLTREVTGNPTSGRFLIAFSLRVLAAQGSRIWNAPSDLEVENPMTLRECGTKVLFINKILTSHPLLGFGQRSPFIIKSVEVVLRDAGLKLRLIVVRPSDPDCELPLPRRLEDYDLAPNVRVEQYLLIRSKYHASLVDLACYWRFDYTLKETLA